MYVQERTEQLEDPIAQAIVYLDSCCDGANSKDKRGFNGYDSPWGKALAAELRQGHTLTPKERWDALKKLKKHKRQLSEAGITLPDRVSEPFSVLERISEADGGESFSICNEAKGTYHTVFTDSYAVWGCSCEAHSKWNKWCDHMEHVRQILLREPKVIELLNFTCEPPVKPCEPKCTSSVTLKPAQGLRESVCEPDLSEIAEKKLEEDEENSYPLSPHVSPHEIGLSKNQLEAFKMAIDWFENDPKVPFVLRGYAGTGKTFCIQRIIKELKDRHLGLKVALVAPTNKAVHVLKDMARKADLKGVHINTLHGLCHTMPGNYTPEGKQKLKLWRRTDKRYYTEFDLVVIDESSMVGTELLKFIPFEETPTIFMGDPAQLPPVEAGGMTEDEHEVLARRMNFDRKTGLEAFSPDGDSPIFFLGTKMELTEVMRYEGKIAEYVTSLRQDISSPNLIFPEGKGNVSTDAEAIWTKKLIQCFLHAKNIDDVRALAWTNKRVDEINGTIRKAIYQDVSEPYVNGERLTAKEPIILRLKNWRGYTNPVIVMNTCSECIVQNVFSSTTEIELSNGKSLKDVEIYDLEIYGDDVSIPSRKDDYRADESFREVDDYDEYESACTVTVKVLKPHEYKRVSEFLNEFKSWILSLDKSERSPFWADYYQVLEKFCLVSKNNNLLPRLQYAYALTVHQSQGSTFKNVFVDLRNIRICRNSKQRNQLLYVACSRASNHLCVNVKAS